MSVKVFRGTTTADLCPSCSNFVEIQGLREGDTIRECTRDSFVGNAIPFEVARCGAYRANADVSGFREKALLLDFDTQRDLLTVEHRGYSRPLTVPEFRSGKTIKRRGLVAVRRRRNPLAPPPGGNSIQ